MTSVICMTSTAYAIDRLHENTVAAAMDGHHTVEGAAILVFFPATR